MKGVLLEFCVSLTLVADLSSLQKESSIPCPVAASLLQVKCVTYP